MNIFKRRVIIVGSLVILVLLIVPGYLRVFAVTGDSDAPAYITGDRVLVSLPAYDLRVPYTQFRLVRLADPQPGDMVLCRLEDGRLAIKRVIAGPGTQVSLHGGSRVALDGEMLKYLSVGPEEEARIRRGRLGPALQLERGNGPDLYVSFDSAGTEPDDRREFTVPEGSYFILGANRDVSIDSRHFGALPRSRILGKVIARF